MTAPRRRQVPTRGRRSIGPVSTLLVAAGGAGTMLGAVGAPRLSEDPAWLYRAGTFDIFNNFIPIWAALLALGLVLALVRRRQTSRLFLGLGALLLAAALAPIAMELSRAPPPAADGPGVDPRRSIRLVQFNALNANHDLLGALGLALEHDADLLMIEEPLAFRGLESYLQARFPFRTPCPNDRCRAIIYSRLPPLDARYEILRGSWDPNRWSGANGPVAVASMRLRGPDGEPFEALATHLRWPHPALPAMRQRDVLLGHLAKLDRTRTILAGDFNLAPWTYEMQAFDAGARPMRRMTRALFTFPTPFSSKDIPAPFAILPIDHVFAGSRWRLVGAGRGPDAGSDHYPVIVELNMAAEPGGA